MTRDYGGGEEKGNPSRAQLSCVKWRNYVRLFCVNLFVIGKYKRRSRQKLWLDCQIVLLVGFGLLDNKIRACYGRERVLSPVAITVVLSAAVFNDYITGPYSH